jgi:hypothetical protein
VREKETSNAQPRKEEKRQNYREMLRRKKHKEKEK